MAQADRLQANDVPPPSQQGGQTRQATNVTHTDVVLVNQEPQATSSTAKAQFRDNDTSRSQKQSGNALEDNGKPLTYAGAAASTSKRNSNHQQKHQQLLPRKQWDAPNQSKLVDERGLSEKDHIFSHRGWYCVFDDNPDPDDDDPDDEPWLLEEVDLAGTLPPAVWEKMLAWSDTVRAEGCKVHGLCKRNLNALKSARDTVATP